MTVIILVKIVMALFYQQIVDEALVSDDTTEMCIKNQREERFPIGIKVCTIINTEDKNVIPYKTSCYLKKKSPRSLHLS